MQKIYKNKNGDQRAKKIKAFKWIKPDDSENLTKIPKHDKRISLSTILSSLPVM